jgi:probable F420-dependent oxidoreductase
VRSDAVLGLWQDRAPTEALASAEVAEGLGYRRLWIGEMATYDAFALATAVAGATSHIQPVVGPLAVTIRTPATIAMGIASITSLTGRIAHVALGTSSHVVTRWHGRTREGAAGQLAVAAQSVRTLLGGDRDPDSGFRLRLPPVPSELAIAAFGPKAVRTAATFGDRMVLNMVTPAAVARFRDALDAEGSARIPMSAWLVTAVDPGPGEIAQIRSALVGYLGAPGYGEMFAEAGYAGLVDRARSGAHPRDLIGAIPDGFERSVGLVGSKSDIASLLGDYAMAGLDTVCVVPVTATGDHGRRALGVVAELTSANEGG